MINTKQNCCRGVSGGEWGEALNNKARIPRQHRPSEVSFNYSKEQEGL